MSIQELAKMYYDLGLSIIPEAQKVPLVKSKLFYEQRASFEQVQGWFKSDYKDGIAVICGKVSGNLEIVDFEAESKYLEFFTVEGAKRLETQTIVTNTTHKGVHVWLIELGELSKTQIRLCESPNEVDLLSEGHKITVPPTAINHLLCDSKNKICPKSGTTAYSFRGSGRSILTMSGIQKSILKRADELGWKTKQLNEHPIVAATTATPAGTRNERAFRYARYLLFRIRLPDDIVLHELERVNKELFQPPLSEQELKLCLEQAKKYPREVKEGELVIER